MNTVTVSLKHVDEAFARMAKSAAYARGMTLKDFIVQTVTERCQTDADRARALALVEAKAERKGGAR
jgi:hypothetical protein